MPRKPALQQRAVKSTVEVRNDRELAQVQAKNKLLEEQLQSSKRALEDAHEEAERAKTLRLEQLLATTEDRCRAMEIMGRALNRQAYELALNTRQHTKSLDTLNAFMSSVPTMPAAPTSSPVSATVGAARPLFSPLPPPYSPARASPLSDFSAPQAPRTSLPPPYTPIRSSPLVGLHTMSAPSPPRSLTRHASAPAAFSSERALFPHDHATESDAAEAIAPDRRLGDLPELRNFLWHLTADVSSSSATSTSKKTALIDAIIGDAVHARHLTTSSPLRTAASVLLHDATNSRNAIDIAAASSGGPSYTKVQVLLKEPRDQLTMPEAWQQHDAIIVVDNNQVSLAVIDIYPLYKNPYMHAYFTIQSLTCGEKNMPCHANDRVAKIIFWHENR